ncbi:Qat anti-phage system QueC-like protein QatC [Zobellia sp. 1_MG-2023]|uniref:Qat anti-phage system QueC-like protein QatC n=1 Tax=Zobellia sp. 1_MG-2023 TaxID=3062626 RepID=UPI0026E20611|nr:Qat anti-phage system QueC-like protein QatC [Zobellia sp. 1_MG-2023]MDO6819497.1 7-cyano-7-deazaguanine synthase [Zobellia sp. 1_MG-2023]
MKINIQLNEAIGGNFSTIKLVFNNPRNDHKEEEIELTLRSFDIAYDLTNDTKSIKFDLFLISALVYGIDNLLDRKYCSDDGWAREIEVVFPVYNLDKWQGQEIILQDALKFLTGDYWSINFNLNTIQNCYIDTKKKTKKNTRKFNSKNIKETSLFSGGLDSLIGIIDILERLDKDEEILLVSHFDFKSPGPSRDQNILFKALIKKYPNKIQNNWIQIKLALNRKNSIGEKFETESNYRSRSFFFIGLGCFLSPSSNLVIPENGTISINYPLTPSRVSSLSTRTTHPYVISKLQTLIKNLGINIELQNPYSLFTKGEMVVNCMNSALLNVILENSTSCGKPGRKQTWKRKDTNHCGVCMPCIYRRASLNKSGKDNQIYGSDITKPLSTNSFTDMPALINYLKKDISLEQMKRDILINGSIPLENLEEYAEMVLRSKEEVLNLFRDKGNPFVKSELGV